MTTIDKRLTEINIDELIDQIGVPFESISNEDIEECINNKIFLATHCIYKGNKYYYPAKIQYTKEYHLLKIATIVNEIQTNAYNYNYPIVIWDDSEEDSYHKWDTDGNGEHYIRAFYYCKKNIYMSINRSC